MPRPYLDPDPVEQRRLGLRTSPQTRLKRPPQIRVPVWLNVLVIGVLVTLGIWRWRLEGYLPQSYALWWRAASALGSGDAPDPALGLYAPALPLFHGLCQGILGISRWVGDDHMLVGLQGLALVIWIWVGLWCWGQGNFWSLGLWGLSPWGIELGLDPNPEGLAALLLLLGCVTAWPYRFIWLGLSCGVAHQAWPVALLLALLWTGQSWPRYRALGLYGVLGAIGLTLIGLRTWPGLAPIPLPVSMPTQTGQIWLSVLAPLSLCLGLAGVRVIWPGPYRQQAGIAVIAGGSVGVGLLLLWLGGWRGTLWGEAVARLGLVVWPLLCYVAGGVLGEIRSRRWQQGLGILLLCGSLALSGQSLALWSHRVLLLKPAEMAAQWLQEHRHQIGGAVVMDSASIAYLSGLPAEQVISSAAAQHLYGEVLAQPVQWVVINQAEVQAWGRSLVVQDHPEFTTTSEISGWELVYVNQEVIPPISSFDLEGSPIAALSQPTIGIPIVQIWHRTGLSGS